MKENYATEMIKHIAVFLTAFACIITASYGISQGCANGEHFYTAVSCIGMAGVIAAVVVYIKRNIINTH